MDFRYVTIQILYYAILFVWFLGFVAFFVFLCFCVFMYFFVVFVWVWGCYVDAYKI